MDSLPSHPPHDRSGIPDEIRRRLEASEGDRLEAVYLFGSRTTGRARAASDWDVGVVLREPVEDWAEDTLRLSTLFYDTPFAVDLHVFGAREFACDAAIPGTLPYTIHRHGVRLCAPR